MTSARMHNVTSSMHVSDELSRFCSGLHQDFMLYGSQPQDWINGALQFVRKERLVAFRNYLNELLIGGYSDAQLQELHQGTRTELGKTLA
jgi:hypothetical protein